MPEDRPPLAGTAGLPVSALAALCLATIASGQELPQTAPAPEVFRKGRQVQPEAAPVPAPRPETSAAAPGAPQSSPTAGPPGMPAAASPSPIGADPRSAMRPDPSGKLPAREAACRRRLTALGAEFEARAAAFDGEAGCSVPYPLMLRSFGRGIEIQPAAVTSCAMAEAAARFVQEVAAPAARAVFGRELDGVSQASAYVCRPRHGGRKLSEHAFGNALDIASFTLSDGTSVAVEPLPETAPAMFLGKLRRAACGTFSTVLGPGSDADHATHLHFDLQPRRNGGSYCR